MCNAVPCRLDSDKSLLLPIHVKYHGVTFVDTRNWCRPLVHGRSRLDLCHAEQSESTLPACLLQLRQQLHHVHAALARESSSGAILVSSFMFM